MSKPVASKRTHASVKQSNKQSSPKKPRALHPVKWQWYKPQTWWHRSRLPEYPALPTARSIAKQATETVWQGRIPLGLLTLSYAILSILLVQGAGQSADLNAIKQLLGGAQTSSFVPQLGYLFSSIGSSNSAVGGVYQMILLIIISLAIIWVLRQLGASKPVSFKSSLYEGMYPLIPFVLIFLLLSIQIIPTSAALFLYNTLLSGGIAVTWLEIGIVLSIVVLLLIWSIVMITATIFAFYIVTLPGMTPLRAYRSAKKLVLGRRLRIWRKLIFLPVVLVITIVLLSTPFLLFATMIAPWIFVLLVATALPFAHAYIYQLYREMIK